jgi:hypothetical protein
MYARLHITCQPRPFQLFTRAPFLYDSGAITPELFFDGPANKCTLRGEFALMYAVLEDAFRCFQEQFVSGRQHTQRLAREAEEWFFSEDPHWPFSFVNICAVLGLDPGYIRSGLRRWRQHPPKQLRKERWRAVVSGRRPLRGAA